MGGVGDGVVPRLRTRSGKLLLQLPQLQPDGRQLLVSAAAVPDQQNHPLALSPSGNDHLRSQKTGQNLKHLDQTIQTD